MVPIRGPSKNATGEVEFENVVRGVDDDDLDWMTGTVDQGGLSSTGGASAQSYDHSGRTADSFLHSPTTYRPIDSPEDQSNVVPSDDQPLDASFVVYAPTRTEDLYGDTDSPSSSEDGVEICEVDKDSLLKVIFKVIFSGVELKQLGQLLNRLKHPQLHPNITPDPRVIVRTPRATDNLKSF